MIHLIIRFRSYRKMDQGYPKLLNYLGTKGNNKPEMLVRLDCPVESKYCAEEEDLFFPKGIQLKNFKIKLRDESDNNFNDDVAEFDVDEENLLIIYRLLDALQGHGNCGHSYSVLIGKERFYIDGDGSDYLKSINGKRFPNKRLNYIRDIKNYFELDENESSNNNDKELNEAYIKRVIRQTLANQLLK